MTIVYTILAIIGILLIPLLFIKPRLIPIVLVATMVFTAGITYKGRAFIDDYFLAIIVYVIISLLLLQKIKLIKKQYNFWDKLHHYTFYTLIIYMILQTIRGMLLYGNILYIHWLLSLIMIAIIALLLTSNPFPLLKKVKVATTIVIGAIIHFLIYLIGGYISETMHEVPRWDLQGTLWAQTVNATFPLVIALPAALFLFKQKPWKYKIISLLLLIVSVITAHYYESRAAWFAILFFAATTPIVFRVKRLIFFLIIGFVILFAVQSLVVISNNPQRFVLGIEGSLKGFDAQRKDHLYLPFKAIITNPVNTLFGHGIDAYKTMLIPYVNPNLKRIETTGFGALVVDTGFLGLLLYAVNFGLVARKIIMLKSFPDKSLLLSSLTLTALWLPVTHVLGIFLFHFIIMPEGILYQLGGFSSAESNVQSTIQNSQQQ